MIRTLIRTLKVLGWGVASVVLALLLAFLYYDVTEFQSRRENIVQLIADAHPAERSPPEMLGRLLLTEHHGDLSLQAARLLLSRLDVPSAWHHGLSWHRNSTLWWLLVRLHLSKAEQLTILCSTSFLGRRAYGYEAGAQTYFQRPLTGLTDQELATLVILPRSPSRWSRPDHSEDLLAARDGLLTRTYAAERGLAEHPDDH